MYCRLAIFSHLRLMETNLNANIFKSYRVTRNSIEFAEELHKTLRNDHYIFNFRNMTNTWIICAVPVLSVPLKEKITTTIGISC